VAGSDLTRSIIQNTAKLTMDSLTNPVSKTPAPDLWDCACGEKGIKGNFCPNCGGKRGANPAAWDCACGQSGNTGKFCSNCGSKQGA
jgi:membrane protease subunit (stomatin/prohibitin family)